MFPKRAIFLRLGQKMSKNTHDFALPDNAQITLASYSGSRRQENAAQRSEGLQKLTATLTNLDSGVQERVVITGAFHQTTLENGDVVTKATGRNLLGDPQAGFVVAVGNFSYVFDAEGNLVQPLEGEGQLIDVCALLGAYDR